MLRTTLRIRVTQSGPGVQFLLDEKQLGSTGHIPAILDHVGYHYRTTSWIAHVATAFNSVGLSMMSSPVAMMQTIPAILPYGSWSSPVSIPTVAVNLILLKNNTLLFTRMERC